MDTLTESRHRYLCVDGPIAVGKTTLSRMLSEHYGARLVLEEFDERGSCLCKGISFPWIYVYLACTEGLPGGSAALPNAVPRSAL